MSNEDYVMPDFKGWSHNVVIMTVENGKLITTGIEEALKQAFQQGQALGHRQGYNEGLEMGWWQQQDKGA